MKRKYVKGLIVIVVLIIGGLFICSKIMRPKSNDLPEVRLKEIVNKDKSFAIMVQEQSETDKYQEYSSNTWPGDDYVFKEAKCIDSNGDEIKEAVTYEDGKITLTTNKTVYCTVYFDKSIIGKLRENDPNKVLSTEEVGGMYRYQGVGTEEGVDATHKLVDNNYICFGTNDINKCNCNTEENCDKYMYRIIGVTKDNQLYLIKMKGVEEGGNKTFQWDLKHGPTDCGGDICKWPNVDIYKRLNGENSNGNPVFINNSRYEYMQKGNVWFNKIENHNWLYGDIDYPISSTMLDGEVVYGVQNNGLILYEIETGVKIVQHWEQVDGSWKLVKYQWSPKYSIDAKIGLMYLNEYSLAYDNERILYNDYDTSNWLFIDNNNNTSGSSTEWLISRRGSNPNGFHTVYLVKNNGSIFLDALNIYCLIRPTFYLSSTVNIIKGIGSISDPYILNVK